MYSIIIINFIAKIKCGFLLNFGLAFAGSARPAPLSLLYLEKLKMISNFCLADKSDSKNISQSLDALTKGTCEEWKGLSACIGVIAFS